MKKLFSLAFIIMLLSACTSSTSTLSFSEIEVVPSKVQDLIDSEFKLQLINEVDKGSYIVFRTSGEVKTDVDEQGEKVTIKFDVSEEKDGPVKQNVYYLTLDPEHDVIDILVNGDSVPIDNVTGF